MYFPFSSVKEAQKKKQWKIKNEKWCEIIYFYYFAFFSVENRKPDSKIDDKMEQIKETKL